MVDSGDSYVQNGLDKLVAQLHSQDELTRQHAWQELVRSGHAAVPRLISTLVDPNYAVRWRSAKILGVIRDPAAAVALVDALEDDSLSVRWAASEALAALEDEAMPPLLEALVKCFDSVRLLHGALHVLHELARKGLCDRPVLKVLKALESVEPAATAPWAASAALEALRNKETIA